MSKKQVKRRFPFEIDDSPVAGPSHASVKSNKAKRGKPWPKDQKRILLDGKLQEMLGEFNSQEHNEEFTGQSASIAEDSASLSDEDDGLSSFIVRRMSGTKTPTNTEQFEMTQDSDLEEEFDEAEISSDWDEEDEDEIEKEQEEEEEEERNIYATYIVFPPTAPVCGPKNSSLANSVSPADSTPTTVKFAECGSTSRNNTPVNATENCGTKQVPVSENPIDFFFHLFTDQFFELIIKETNDKASILLSKTSRPKARMRRWKPLTREDLEVFLGLIFLSGHISAPFLVHYWQVNKLYNFPTFRNAMSRDRFFMILGTLYFSKSFKKSDPKPSDPLYKVSSLFDLFHRRMKEIYYYPTKKLNLDEPMVLSRGRLYFRKHIRNKHHKFSVKLYMLTQPNGIVLRTRFCCGSNDPILGQSGHVDKVIKYLVDDYYGIGHSVYKDNVSSSEDPLDINTSTTGTLRRSRKGYPGYVLKKNLKKVQVMSEYKRNGVCILKWHDQRDVLPTSTEFGPPTTECTPKSGKTSEKPEAVSKSNKSMSGIDWTDQLVNFYPCKRKTLMWYLKIAFHLFQIIMNNAFLLYKEQPHKHKATLLDFRESVIMELIYRNRPASLTKVSANERTHIPSSVPRNAKNRQIRKRCVVCSKNNKRTESVFFCDQCPEKPGLCLERCFKSYHNY